MGGGVALDFILCKYKMDRSEIKELFGEDSDTDEVDDHAATVVAYPGDDMSPPPLPRGLQYFSDMLKDADQDALQTGIQTQYPGLLLLPDQHEQQQQQRQNQAMYFAPMRAHPTLPTWAETVGLAVRAQFMAADARTRPFDQMILNSYAPGTGLAPHRDLARFADPVAVVSLGSPLVMDLCYGDDFNGYGPSGPLPEANLDELMLSTATESLRPDQLIAVLRDQGGPWIHWVHPRWARVLLVPGSVLLLEGDARWTWTHGIRAAEHEHWPLDRACHRVATIPRGYRSSVTMRSLADHGDP
ncbi:hypothetical protein BC828DRAFT_372383 [Blastocladiella britannica]|nr:hypothetical protein BC828DRAFT_372383 [Blastocladiella britannica]